MSFVRWGEEGSRVYVYAVGDIREDGSPDPDAHAYICCDCEVLDDPWAMAAHLREHVRRGEHVPERVIRDLLADGVAFSWMRG